MTWTNRGWNRFGSVYTEKRAAAPVNEPPVANSQSVSVVEDGSIFITMTGSDPEGAPLTYIKVDSPSHGTLAGIMFQDGYITYIPNANYTGPDSFTFQVSDGTNLSNIATVSIDVQLVSQLSADYISTQEIAAPLTFSRASAGTYYDYSGALRYAASNAPRFTHNPTTLARQGLLIERQSTNSFIDGRSMTSWTTYNSTKQQNTPDTVAPDGSSTVLKVTESGSNGGHEININGSASVAGGTIPLNARHVGSIFAKAGTRTRFTMRVLASQYYSDRYSSVTFDLTTGVARPQIGPATGSSFILSYGMEQHPDGWWRCWVSFRNDSSFGNLSTAFTIALDNGTPITAWGVAIYPSEGKDMYFWGAQLELNTDLPSSPILTDNSAVTRAADNLKLSSTAGWYNDSAWTVIHDTAYAPEADPTGSLDPGTWEAYAGQSQTWLGLTWAKEMGLFVAVADGGTQRVMTSPDGETWTLRNSPSASFHGVTWNGYNFVAVAYSGTNRVATSPDGVTWTARNAAEANGWLDVVWSPELQIFVAVASSGTNRVMTSDGDGEIWTARSAPIASWRRVVWSPQLSKFVAVGAGSSNGAMTSPDGIVWTAHATPAGDSWGGVAWSPELGLFVAVGYDGANRIMTSPDGEVWTARTAPAANNWISVAWSSEIGKFVATASGGTTADRVMTSSNGIDWTLVPYMPVGTPEGTKLDSTCDLRTVVWSRELGVFAGVGAFNTFRVRLSAPLSTERRLMRYKTFGPGSDAWVTGSATGFLGSGINSTLLSSFSYYDRYLTAAEIDRLLDNPPPVASSKQVVVAPDGYVSFTLTGTDIDASPLTFTLLSSPTNGVLSGTIPNLTYTPTLGYIGSDSFTFKVNDGYADSAPATVSILVNRPPVADAQSVSVGENGSIGITLTGSDPDGHPLTYIILVPPINGTVSGIGANVTYTPNINYEGSDSFIFCANDGYTNSAPATVSITVFNTNDPPVANPQSVSVNEDSSLAITLTGSDPDGNPLTYAIVTQPTRGTLSGTAPNVTYTPFTEYFGSDSFTFKVNDGYLDSTPATISIAVNAVNSPPVAYAQSLATEMDTPLAIELTASDTNTGGYYTAREALPSFTYTVVSGPTNGSLSGTAPFLTYTPTTSYTGSDSFTYKVNDGTVDSSTVTISINVAAAVSPAATLEADFIASQTIPSQLAFTRASTGTYYDSAGILQTAAIDAPRFTYDPTTLRLTGLMLERAATNTVTEGRGMSNWQLTNTSRALNTAEVLAPDGTNTATKLTETGSSAFDPHLLRLTTGAVNFSDWNNWNRRHTASVFVKAGTRSHFVIRPSFTDLIGTTRYISVLFDLTTGGSQVYVGSTSTGSYILEHGMQQLPNGWWRCWVSWIATGFPLDPALNAFSFAMSDGIASMSGWNGLPRYLSEGKHLYVWGAQIELDTDLPTSPIITTGTAATRADDALDVSDTTGWYDDTEWTVVHTARYGTKTDPASPQLPNTWRQRTAPANINYTRICWSRELGLFAAVASSGSGNRIATSPDGITWTARTTPNQAWSGITWSPELGLFCAVSGDGTDRALLSNDGITWTSQNVPAQEWNSITWSSELGLFLAGSWGGTSKAMTSPDGVNWTLSYVGIMPWCAGVGQGNGRLFAFGSNTISTSTDGINWSAQTISSGFLFGLVWAPELGKYFVAADNGGNRVLSSTNGTTWVVESGAPALGIRGIAWSGEEGYLAVSLDGSPDANLRYWTSPDGSAWTSSRYYATYADEIFQTLDAQSKQEAICWSRQLGIFIGVAQNPINQRIRSSASAVPDRTLMRYRSTGATDTWVTGTGAGFLGSTISNTVLSRFAYFDRKLTNAELAALGV